MILYHGSDSAGLKELRPHISEHKKPYIYFASNPVVATLYTVHKAPRPYHWFPYGFNRDNTPVYTEYYPHALADVYRGQRGYLYLCSKLPALENPTEINCAYVCEKPVPVDRCIVLDDVYRSLLDYEKAGLFVIRRYEELSEKQKENILNMIEEEIQAYHLLSLPHCGYSRFIRERFPQAWKRAAWSESAQTDQQ